jgi:hypothetical protein
MPHADTITACPPAAGRGLRAAARTAAWALWLGIVVVATVAGFRTVEAFARPEFARQVVTRADTVAPVGRFITPIPLAEGMVVRQNFEVDRDGLSGIRVQAVTWGATPDPQECTWSLLEVGRDGATRRVVRRGTVDPTRLTDWSFIEIAFEPIADSGGGRYALKFTAGPGRPARLVGLPLFETAFDHTPPVVRAATEAEPRPVPASATLHMKLVHLDAGG